MSQLQVTGEAKIRDIQGPVVANSGVITALDGAASQYVRGDGTLADFPTSTGGGSSVSYYLNGSVNQGTFAGSTYYEMSKTPIIGAGTDFAVSTNGLVAQFITDANDPDLLEVPGGNFNLEFYFSVSNNTGNPTVYAELYKYDGTTFTLLGSSQAVPESINQGTTIAPYYFAIPVGTAALALTDRIAIRIYANVDGRTVTLHTENSHLCQVVTTFSKGMVSLNNLTDQSQFITTGTSGTDFNIVSTGDTHTFNIPSASASNRGLITTGSQTIAGIKTLSVPSQFEQGLYLKQNMNLFQAGYIGLGASTTGLIVGLSGGGFGTLNFNNTTSFTYTFPNATGTIALTSDLSSYVPYTGATTNVDLGVYNLSANQVIAGGAGVNNAGTFTTYDGGVATQLIGSTGNLKFFPFWNPSIGARINAENSAGSAYIPLSFYATAINLNAPTTLTGALSGTSATFSGLLTINVPTDNTTVGIFHAGGGTANRGLKISTFVSVNDNAGVRLDAQTTAGGATLALATAGVDRLTIASTGAATFSSSIALSASSGFPAVGLLNRSSDNNLYMVAASSGFVLLDNSQNTMYNATPTSHTWQISNSPKMTLNSSGNVGIGTSTIVANDGTSRTFQMGTRLAIQNVVGTQFLLSSNLYYDGAWKYMVAGKGQAIRGTGESGTIQFSLSPTGTAGGSVPNMDGSDVKMIILESGNVGIGTSSPQMPLSVQANTGNAAIRLIGTSNASSNNAGIYWYDSNDSTFNGYLGNFSTSFEIYNQRSTPMSFYTAGIERMRILSNSDRNQVVIGTDTVIYTSANRTNLTLGTSGTVLFGMKISGVSKGYLYHDGNEFQMVGDGISNIGLYPQNAVNAGADNAYTMGASGRRWSAIWAANGTIQTSDERQKKDITPTNLGLDFILKLNPVSYKWKVGGNEVETIVSEDENKVVDRIITPIEGKRNHYGLIAQEVKEVLGDIDFGGYVYDEETDTMALRYDQFISPMIKAIQELEARIKQLENK